jgi:hypothetical protein
LGTEAGWSPVTGIAVPPEYVDRAREELEYVERPDLAAMVVGGPPGGLWTVTAAGHVWPFGGL